MKNAITFYYGIQVDEFFDQNGDQCFIYFEYKYIYHLYDGSDAELNRLIEISNLLYQNGVDVYTFIKCKDGKYFSIFNNQKYILMRVNLLSGENISLYNIIKFNESFMSSNMQLDSWSLSWSKKIDELEFYLNDLGEDFNIVQNSCDYFIGMSENAISYLDNIKKDETIEIAITHKEMNENGFYNPLNLMLDYKIRDVAEYAKNKLLKYEDIVEDVLKLIQNNYFNYNSALLFFARLLFPKYYFDLVKDILDGKQQEEMIKYILDNINFYLSQLRDTLFLLNKYFAIPMISWISK